MESQWALVIRAQCQFRQGLLLEALSSGCFRGSPFHQVNTEHPGLLSRPKAWSVNGRVEFEGCCAQVSAQF